MSFRAKEIFDGVRTLNHDLDGSNFTDSKVLPYLVIAYDEVLQFLQDSDIPVVNEVATNYVITTAMKDIGGPTGFALPPDLITPQSLYERTSGSNEDFQLMTKTTFLPTYVALTNSLIYWSWQKQQILFLGANSVRDVKIEYIGTVFPPIVDANSMINIINSKNTLKFRTAALSAEFIGENPTRAQSLNSKASIALEMLMNVETKAQQNMITRRRPFMGRYKTTRMG